MASKDFARYNLDGYVVTEHKVRKRSNLTDIKQKRVKTVKMGNNPSDII